jgi:hypothetical protein
MAGSPPNYDDVMMPGAGGIRVPTEVFGSGGAGNPGGTFALTKQVTIAMGVLAAAATVNLNPSQTAASEIVVTGSGAYATTLVLPGAFPGAVFVLYNNTANNVTLKVTGQTGVTVATGKRAVLVCEATDIARVTADT